MLPYVICGNPAVSVPIRVPFNRPQMHTAKSGMFTDFSLSADETRHHSPEEAPQLGCGEASRCQLVGGLATHPGKPRSLAAGRSQLSNDVAGEVTIPGGELRGIRGRGDGGETS